MPNADPINAVFREEPPLTRRERRAAKSLARAYSPVRIFMSILGVPVTAAAMTVSIYTAASDYPPEDALRHLIALGGCPAADTVGLAPAREGELGYHPRNDLDRNGVACGPGTWTAANAASLPGAAVVSRVFGGAKFVRP